LNPEAIHKYLHPPAKPIVELRLMTDLRRDIGGSRHHLDRSSDGSIRKSKLAKALF
jgi:hypothetical protein